MKRAVSGSLAFTLALALAGCGYTETHEVVLRAASPPTGRPVEVYMSGQPPPRPFYEVALLQVIGHGSDANLEDVIRALTQRAATLGCDALVRIQIDQGYSLSHGFGVCVRWAPGIAPVPAPAPVAPAPAPAPPPAPAPAPPPAGGA
jgi:hypothetical protein